MEEKCAVVHRVGSLLTISFFGTVVYIDDAECVTRHDRPEVHLIVDYETKRATAMILRSEGTTEVIAHNSTSH